jgi:hypothetical protein
LGVDFFIGTIDEASETAVTGSVLGAPTGPRLAAGQKASQAYRQTRTTSDLAITDSEWTILRWSFFTGENSHATPPLRSLVAFPHETAANRRRPYSVSRLPRRNAMATYRGFKPKRIQSLTPIPQSTHPARRDRSTMPRSLPAFPPCVLATSCWPLAAEIQESLSASQRQYPPYRPANMCLHAANAFLTFGHAKIPPRADGLFWGSFLRLLSSPRKFWKRCWITLSIDPLRYRNREHSQKGAACVLAFN